MRFLWGRFSGYWVFSDLHQTSQELTQLNDLGVIYKYVGERALYIYKEHEMYCIAHIP